MDGFQLARYIVDVIADKKGEDVVLLDVRERTSIADYFVICNGTSERQLKAIAEGITEHMKQTHRVVARFVEGNAATGWMLIDYNDVIVHIFTPERRSFYDLESFWAEAAVLLKMQ